MIIFILGMITGAFIGVVFMAIGILQVARAGGRIELSDDIIFLSSVPKGSGLL